MEQEKSNKGLIGVLIAIIILLSLALVYVLFGKDAQSFKSYIDDKHNDVLEVSHPAYYARTNTSLPSDLFRFINRIMYGRYGVSIKFYEQENN